MKYTTLLKRKYRKKYPWTVNYTHAEQRCNNPNNHNYKFYGAKGIKFLLTLEQVKDLYHRDKASTMIRPTIDRINTYGNYEYTNCRFIEFETNNKRSKRKDKDEDS